MYRLGALAAALVVAAAFAALPAHSLRAGDVLVYDLDMRMGASGIGIQHVNMSVHGTVKMEVLIVSDEYVAVRVVPDLVVEGAPSQYENIIAEMNRVRILEVPAYSTLDPLSEEGGPWLSDIISVLKEQLQALGFNQTSLDISEVMYRGVPSLKVSMQLNAINYLGMGTNVEIRALTYLDMSSLTLLHGEALAKYSSNTGGFYLSYEITLENPEVLQQGLAGYEIRVEGGEGLSVVFAAQGLEVGEPSIGGDKVSFTVAGEGLGSLIIKAGPGTPEPEVYVDGAPKEGFKVGTAGDGATYYKVPLRFSRHRVDIVLGRPVVSANAVELSLPAEGGGPAYSTTALITAAAAAAAVAAAVVLKLAKRGKGGPGEQPPPPPPPPPVTQQPPSPPHP